MADNCKLSSIKISFQSEKPFTVREISDVFILIEDIYKDFANQLLENFNFSLVFNDINFKENSFSLIPLPDSGSVCKYSDFEEITLCFLYGIYSFHIENNPEPSNDLHKAIFKLLDLVNSAQRLKISSIINDKIVSVVLSEHRNVAIYKENLYSGFQKPKNKLELAKLYGINKQKVFTEIDLEHEDLSFLDLREVDFTDSSFYESNMANCKIVNSVLNNCDLSSVNLFKANFTDSTLISADLSLSNLFQALLASVNLENADLSSANLTEARFINVNISGTDFSGANLTNASFLNGVIYNDKTDFSGNANWWDAHIENEDFLKWLNQAFPKKDRGLKDENNL